MIPVLFLKCLQTLPCGASIDRSIELFSRCSSLGEYDKCLNIQAIKSMPFLFLSKQTSASRLIPEILLPVLSQESKELLVVLIDTIVDLVCVCSGAGQIKRYFFNFLC